MILLKHFCTGHWMGPRKNASNRAPRLLKPALSPVMSSIVFQYPKYRQLYPILLLTMALQIIICHCASLKTPASFVFFFIIWASFYYPLLGSTRSWSRCWAAIRLFRHPEPSDRAVHEGVDGLDIGGQHGRRFVLLRHTHRSQRRPYPICTSRNGKVRHRYGSG